MSFMGNLGYLYGKSPIKFQSGNGFKGICYVGNGNGNKSQSVGFGQLSYTCRYTGNSFGGYGFGFSCRFQSILFFDFYYGLYLNHNSY